MSLARLDYVECRAKARRWVIDASFMLQLATNACSGLRKSGAFLRATAPKKRQAMSECSAKKGMPRPAHTEEHLGCRTDVQVSVGVPTCVSDQTRMRILSIFCLKRRPRAIPGTRDR
jgi:hypothetical protein